jgi:extradiol dioxygenase family protein
VFALAGIQVKLRGMALNPPFHLAFPVTDIDQTRAFYGGLLECTEGRSAERWIDFDFWGHQLSAHLVDERSAPAGQNPVDGDSVPIPHFGVVLPWGEWAQLRTRLEESSISFIIAPRFRFEGHVGEQGTFFITDPSGNTLEFKSFKNPSRLFEGA